MPPETCVAFEDSITGIRAARAAGMAVVAVPEPAAFDHPGFDGVELKLRSLGGFSAGMLDGLRP